MAQHPGASDVKRLAIPSNTRLFVVSATLLLLFLFLAAAAFFSGRAVERASRLISIDAVPGWQLANSMRLSISVCARASVQVAITDDPVSRSRNIEEAHQADAAFREAFLHYEATSHIDPKADHQLLTNLRDRYEDFTHRREAFEALVTSGRRAESLAYFEREVIPGFKNVIRESEILMHYNQTNAITLTNRIVADLSTLRATVLIVLGLASICVVILVFNFVSRCEAQRTLEASEQRLRNTLDNLVIFAGLCEPDGTVVEANQTALDASGIQREQVIGRSFSDLPWWTHSVEARAKVRTAINDAAQGKAVRFDTDNQLAGGKVIIVDFSCSPIRDAAGRITHLVVSGIDITERKNLEAQFIRAQRLEAVGTLSAGLAHDLNNILAPMLMASSLLKLKLNAPEDQKLLTMIESGAQRGAGIIRQLLTFSRGTEGPLVNLQIGSVLQDVAHMIEETFSRRISFKLDAPDTLWSVTGDPTQLHQAVLNLCINARDAMPDGGTLSIKATNIDLSESEARSRPEAKPGRHVHLRVADTGEGIPREHIDRIFDPFFTTKPVGQGTGLGLFSVLGIVRNHGGFMSVESEPGRGTTFDIYLPVFVPKAEESPASADDELPHGNGELLLLVDDEAPLRESVRKALESHGYQVLCAGNGVDAIRLYLANQTTIRLVITDLEMPVMGGAELVRSLRVANPGVRCVALTGSMGPTTLASLLALALDDTLEKPFSIARLLKSIHAIVSAAPSAPGSPK